MPNLEQRAVNTWLDEWRAGPPLDWPPAVRAIETAPSVPALLARVGSALDTAAAGQPHHLSEALLGEPLLGDLRPALCQLGAARALRLLHWISESPLPEATPVLHALLQANDDAGHALRALVEAMRRRAVLDRIFDPGRLAALESALETANQQTVTEDV